MILFYTFFVVVLFIIMFSVWNWWRDEQERLGKVSRRTHVTPDRAIPAVVSRNTPLHPTIDPYLAELRVYLLTEPLPQGPGDMANRVYTHLNQWITLHANDGTPYDDFEFHEVPGEEQEPEPGFINMSRNSPVPPPGYLENLIDGVNRE